MNHFIWRTMIVSLLAVSMAALSANAQTSSDSGANQNKNQQSSQQNAQNNTNQARRDTTNLQGQPKQNIQQTQPNRNAVAQPNLPVQPGVQNQQAPTNLQNPAGIDNRANSLQNNQRSGANLTVPQAQGILRQRTAFRPTEMRGPDIGLWFNRATRDGLVISDVSNRGAIAKFGFREGDRIVSVNGRAVISEPQFIEFLLTGNVNRADVVVFRDGRNQTIVVDPAVLTQEYAYTEVAPLEQFGIVLDDRFNDRIVVWRVIPQSPAFYAGFRPGDVITTLSGQPFRTRAEFEQAVVGLRSGQANVQVRRGDRTRDLLVDVPQFQRSAPGTGIQSERRAERIEQRDNRKIDQRQDNQVLPNLNAPTGDDRGRR
jgi:C-terminal processing protease CtpA/Prc